MNDAATLAAVAAAKTGTTVNIKATADTAAPKLNADQVGVKITDANGRVLGYAVTTKSGSDTSAAQTLGNHYGNALITPAPTTNDDKVNQAYANLLTDANVTGYGASSLTLSQLQANQSALNGSTYGNFATVVVAPVSSVALLSGAQFYLDANGSQDVNTAKDADKALPAKAVVQLSNGNYTNAGSLSTLAANALQGVRGTKPSDSQIQSALKAAGLDKITFVYANGVTDQSAQNSLVDSNNSSSNSSQGFLTFDSLNGNSSSASIKPNVYSNSAKFQTIQATINVTDKNATTDNFNGNTPLSNSAFGDSVTGYFVYSNSKRASVSLPSTAQSSNFNTLYSLNIK